MGIDCLVEDEGKCTPPRTPTKMSVLEEEEEECCSRMADMSLNECGSVETDENISKLQRSCSDGNNTTARLNGCVGSTHRFTRSWSFDAPAQERKITLADVRKFPGSNLKIDVDRALARSWSFTKTTRSPLRQMNSGASEFVSLDGEAQETAREAQEVLKVESPIMPSISEESEGSVQSEAVEAELVQQQQAGPQQQAVVPQLVPQKKPAFKVKPLARSLVVPSSPVEKHWLLLSNLDRVVNPTFSTVIHYYPNVIDDTRSFGDVTSFLKETLAKTLVDFYPLAGRLELRDDGKVDLHCNNAGAVWIEAAVNSDLHDIGGPRPNHLLSGFDVARVGPGPLYIPDQITPMPLLIIQATKFTCGSVAIATSWHHTIADGFSGTHFLRSWSEVALGQPISLKPHHNRDILSAREPPNPTLVNGYSTECLDDTCGEGAQVSTKEPATLEKFNLSREAVAKLKVQANLQPPPFTPRPYTSAESISGHLWRQMTKARAAANSYDADRAKDQTTKFFMFVDGRKRLRLPPGFFGNVVCSACAVAKEADILTKPLHYAASLIRIATRNITEEYFRSLIDWVELQGMASSKSEHVNSLGHDVAATFWTFFPLYEIEFGWGRPTFAARNSPPRPLIDGIAMMPKEDGKGMVALLNLHSDRMSKLQRQISFATVFES